MPAGAVSMFGGNDIAASLKKRAESKTSVSISQPH